MGAFVAPSDERRAQRRVADCTQIPALLRQFGVVDPNPVLLRAGIAPDTLASPDNLMPYRAWGELLKLSAEVTQCAQFGLLAGRMCHLKDLGPMAEIVRHSATLGEALETLVAYQHVNSAGSLSFMMRRATIVDFGYAIYYERIAGADQLYDYALAAALNFIQELVGPAWMPSEVFLPHAGPADRTHYRRMFKLVPHFDSEMCALRFPAYWLDRPVMEGDPQRKRAALTRLDRKDPDLVQQALRNVRLLLLREGSSGDALADMLSLQRRTLNRRLRERGTTFQELLDRVRFEAARQLLSHSNVALDDIAAALDFNGVSSFMRAFRRWSGATPGQWRGRARRDQFEFVARATAAPLPPNATGSAPVVPPQRVKNAPQPTREDPERSRLGRDGRRENGVAANDQITTMTA